MVKSSVQKDKVMAFTFIKMAYKEYCRKRKERQTKACEILELFSRNKIKTLSRDVFDGIYHMAFKKIQQNEIKFGLKAIDNILRRAISRRHKEGFEHILHETLEKEASVVTTV